MAAYTCLSCQVIFKDAESQRAHYKTDWHRYNLKRKVAELPPVTMDVFESKVAFQAAKKSSKEVDSACHCRTCNKVFSSKNAYENHLGSKKHKDMLSKIAVDGKASSEASAYPLSDEKGDVEVDQAVKEKDNVMEEMMGEQSDDGWEDVDSEEEVGDREEGSEGGDTDALPPSFCLFCPHESVSIEDNVRHMARSHSFFIPDLEFVTDLEAFMTYLGAKVGDGKVCLLCNTRSKQFQSVRACQAHMTDKGHCTLDYEGDAVLEYADFYDFTSTYPEDSTASLDGSVDDSQALSSPLEVDPDTLELILPSGARAGHRSLKQYYKQSPAPESFQQQSRAMIAGVSAQYKALGWHGSVTASETRKKMDVARIQNRKYNEKQLALGVRSNKLQKFFRKQVMFCG